MTAAAQVQIPCAMLMGGLFLLVMDTIARTVTSLEVPSTANAVLFGLWDGFVILFGGRNMKKIIALLLALTLVPSLAAGHHHCDLQ